MTYPLTWQTILLDGEPASLWVPDAAAVRTDYAADTQHRPYWTQVWPASVALARFIQRHPALVKDSSVLELAGGLGLPSLVAARYARSVLFSDYVPEAVEVARRSAKDLGLSNLAAAVLDWNNLPGTEAGVVLLSDVNYEEASFTALQRVIRGFTEAGARVLLSTPQRLVARRFVEPLLPLCRQQESLEVFHLNKVVTVTVFELTGG